jgi:hypothetical protein
MFAIAGGEVRDATCFVLMPFGRDLDNVYETLRSVVEDFAGCSCVRADEVARSNRIRFDTTHRRRPSSISAMSRCIAASSRSSSASLERPAAALAASYVGLTACHRAA